MKLKPNLLLYAPYYAELCNEFAGPIYVIKRQGNTATVLE